MPKQDQRVRAPYYQVASLAQESFRLLEIRGAYAGCSWHFHPECQLGLVISGRGQRVVGDNVCPIHPGEVVLLGSNLPHVWRYDNTGPGEPPVHAIVVHFHDDFAGSEFFRKPELRDVRLLLARAALGLQVNGRTRDEASARIQGMLRHEGFTRMLDLFSVLHLLATSAELTTLCSAGFQPLSADLEVERLRRVCAHVQAHMNDPLPRDEAAALAHLSPSAFSRFFKAHTGKTFHEFVNEVRIGHACRLLMEPEFNVTEVALQCGFADITSFNRSFRRLKRTTPTDYRRRLHAVTQNSQ
ncbi:MAG TPA: AraC family transcriptional regulator [Methylomirabilota bacterium]|nr:AraC family transcriptional regulator [Methylomirabilota bacterium]